VSGDRGAIGGNVGGDEENLILLDGAAIAARQDRARGGPARVHREAALAGHGEATQRFQVRAQIEGAAQATGQRAVEFMDIGLRIDPAPRAGYRAADRERPLGARIAERHHGFRETRRESLDRAAARAGSRHHDLRARIARCRDRPEGQRQ